MTEEETTQGLTAEPENPPEPSEQPNPELEKQRAETVKWQRLAERRLVDSQKAAKAYITKEDLTAFEDRIAAALDATRGQSDDDEYEEKPKRKPTPSEIIRQQRESTKKEVIDPKTALAIDRAIDILENDLSIKRGTKEFEAFLTEDGDYKDPYQVLREAENKKMDLAIARKLDEAKLETTRKQKESGVTKGDGGPSASGSRSFTRSQIGEMSYAEYKANEKDIDAATREGRIT